MTGLSLRTVRSGLASGWIPSRKLGDSRLIPAAWVHALTNAEADAIADRYSPNNQYYAASSPHGRAGYSRLLRPFGDFIRTLRGTLARAIICAQV